MPEGGEITIESSHLAAARSVRLVVQDTGSGIPPDHGTLAVRSEVGTGTTFTLTFPLDA